MVDDYSEDWSALAYVLVHGKAEVMPEGEERDRAASMLREKYPQYRELLPETPTILKITPRDVTGWGRL